MFIIIINIHVIPFMHGIYNYIPETNHVSTVYSVAAVLYLQFVLHVMLFRTSHSLCAVPNVTVILQFLNFRAFTVCYSSTV